MIDAEQYTKDTGEVLALLAVLYDSDEAMAWLKEPQPLLNGCVPAQLLGFSGGKDRVLAILQAVLDGAYL